MPRSLALALALLATVTPILPAQEASTAGDSADVLVLDHDFTGSPEFVRVFLQGKQVYRAELSSTDVTLEVRSPIQHLQPPRVYPIFAPSGSGMSVSELYPESDGEYELRPIGMDHAGVASRLRLYHDAAESRRRVAILDKPGWEVGIEVAAGWNTGYAQSQDGAAVEEGGESGSNVELCFAARRAPGVPRLSMCALGLSHQSQHGAPSILWVFTEPRYRLLGRAPAGHSNWELGALLRAGIGNVSRVAHDPVVLAPGIYLARHIRTAPDGRGWSVLASFSHAWYKGFEKPDDIYNSVTGEFIPGDVATPSSDRLLLGLGWYQ
ncbi:MAG TPA: hypothetical protein VJQ44_18345 [Gemmatimonadales bacterium]|nr:hypothetical protein [Gemmatimonadales bacterium]